MGRFAWCPTSRWAFCVAIESGTRTMAGLLDYENVVKDYGSAWSRQRVRALNDFTLSLERGEIFGFLGPNGAGKTTAIHLALGFMRPSSGSGCMLDKPF